MTRRPFVLINVAATVDGKIDTFERRGASISSDRDWERVDSLRASSDAIMVGSHTLHDEDPRLTVRSSALRAERLARGEPENPAKVAVTTRPRLRPEARFLSTGPARILIFCPLTVSDPELAPLTALGVEVYRMEHERVDLSAVMSRLAALGLRRVLVEGGGSLNFELLRLGLVDEVHVYVAPRIFGGATAPTMADGPGLAFEAAVLLKCLEVEPWPDGGVLLRYKVEPR